jgi:deoxyxylulose-5-phosphate synthase
MLQLGIPDFFIEHGSRETCLLAARLDASAVSDRIERWWRLQSRDHLRSAAGA